MVGGENIFRIPLIAPVKMSILKAWAPQRQANYMGLRNGLFGRATAERNREEYHGLTDSPTS